MTYKESLEKLRAEVDAKGKIYASASPSKSEDALIEWEEAGKRYRDLIAQMRRKRAMPNDMLPKSFNFPKVSPTLNENSPVLRQSLPANEKLQAGANGTSSHTHSSS